VRNTGIHRLFLVLLSACTGLAAMAASSLVPVGTAPVEARGQVPPAAPFCGASEQPGWPIRILRGGGRYLSAAPVVADLDGDGTMEIVAAGVGDWVWIWNHDGTRRRHWPRRIDAPAYGSPSVGDIDGDGQNEIVVASYFFSTVYAWHLDGRAVEGFPRPAGATPTDKIRGSAVLANLDADPELEIVVATADGLVHVYDAPFTAELAGWPKLLDFNIQTTPAVGDVDGDGEPDIVVRSVDRLQVRHADGRTVAGFPVAAAGLHTSPVIGDFDHDGADEIVDGGLLSVFFYRGDGTTMGTASTGVLKYAFFALGDIDDDGRPELFVGPDIGGVSRIGTGSGLLAGWPVPTAEPVRGSPLVLDADGDGWNDVIAGSYDGLIHAWSHDGSETCPPVDLGGEIFVSPAAGDLDGDGDVELVVATLSGEVHVFDLTAPWDPRAAGWTMVQADPRHTGHYPAR